MVYGDDHVVIGKYTDPLCLCFKPLVELPIDQARPAGEKYQALFDKIRNGFCD